MRGAATGRMLLAGITVKFYMQSSVFPPLAPDSYLLQVAVRWLPPLQPGLARLRAARLGRRRAGRGGAHEGRHARGWGHPNPSRQRLQATPSSDERSRITSL